ncbi:RNA polymerase-binding protein DksA [Buchnera aphidicola (Aphis craccivora)]|uniref:RNA polymerase-binding transcription factor DksA n=1 Tax=Buchnera aphidicola (Aphis craccivora) TaxID=466616 RepID=A0A4D6XGX1_9GAMM|nr:RNA polymerase-binding protein DksA [Buchnera aphidicola]QCI16456.1 RNA polymerase-binding protein DksA [Buchnera aphidicola (Aphis craccivora)]QLL40595.1 RNA polymerase-binding protein DksA [Buchnera aphidicola (Aphis craccivore)]WAI17965.1 MAG: RNA polymerase-binding protein DksA [Buchnera aphidicola (Aphis craccivora)]
MEKEKQKKKSSLNVLSIAGLRPYQKKIDEQYMNENQMLHFKKILETWKHQLKFEINHTLLYIQDKSTNFPDPIDRAAQEEEFSLELRNQDRSRKLIKKIELTLKKIKTNDFGYCNSCGIEIGIRRLEARPTASLCIDCKTLAEIREKQMAG